MTPEEYIEENALKPLTDVELDRGKDKLRISGTEELIPWTEVYARITARMSMEHIAEIYGQGRKIALFAKEDGISFDKVAMDFLDNEIQQRKQMAMLEETSPVVAKTMKEMANEYAPDVMKQISELSTATVKRANELIEDSTTNDMKNIWDTMQKMTDTLELTSRHASAASISIGNQINSGAEFVVEIDVPPEKDIIDVKDTD